MANNALFIPHPLATNPLDIFSMGTIPALSALRSNLQTAAPCGPAKFHVLRGPLTMVHVISKIDEGLVISSEICRVPKLFVMETSARSVKRR